jgi:cell division transport system ATP-binding protein
MIAFDNVTKSYGTNIGIQDVSIRINKGDFCFLVGPSGRENPPLSSSY